MYKVAKTFKKLTVQSVALFFASTSLAIGSIQVAFSPVAKADNFMDTYFRNGQVIRLVTPKNYYVNLPEKRDGGRINTYEADQTDEWKFEVVKTTNGVKFKRVGTNFVITSKLFPSSNFAPLEAYHNIEGEDKYQTWIPTPAQSGFFNICLLAQRDQCMNVPNSANRTNLTTYKRNPNAQEQLFSAVVINSGGNQPQPISNVRLKAPVSYGQSLKIIHGYNDPLPNKTCVAGRAPDHCGNQKYGLDLEPSDKNNPYILAPLPGKIAWIDKGCLGITTQDSLNLTVCHFSGVNVRFGDNITQGQVLGTRSTPWIHLNLDDRSYSPFKPIPFDGQHKLEDQSFAPKSDNQSDQYDGDSIKSTNSRI